MKDWLTQKQSQLIVIAAEAMKNDKSLTRDQAISKVLPGRPIVDIPDDDPIMHVFYDLSDRKQLPGLRHLRTIVVNNRKVPVVDQIFWAGYAGITLLPATAAPIF